MLAISRENIFLNSPAYKYGLVFYIFCFYEVSFSFNVVDCSLLLSFYRLFNLLKKCSAFRTKIIAFLEQFDSEPVFSAVQNIIFAEVVCTVQ